MGSLSLNQKIFLYLNSFTGKNKILDFFFVCLAKYSPYIFIFYEFYLYFYKKEKDKALFAFYSATLGIIISKTISLFYFHNRPFMDKLGRLLIYHSPDSSFPSDHTTFMFSLAFSFYFFKVPHRNLFFLLAFLGSIARVFVGVHYPFDILGGLLVGFFSAYIIFRSQSLFSKLNKIIINLEENLTKFLIWKKNAKSK